MLILINFYKIKSNVNVKKKVVKKFNKNQNNAKKFYNFKKIQFKYKLLFNINIKHIFQFQMYH